MKKYTITTYANNPITLAECDTLPELAEALKAAEVQQIRAGYDGSLRIHFTSGGGWLAQSVEIYPDALYFAFDTCFYVAKCSIVDTVPAGYTYHPSSPDTKSDYVIFNKSANGTYNEIIDRVAIKTTPEQRAILNKYARDYYIYSLTDCRRAKKASRKQAAEILTPVYNSLFAPGTPAAFAADKAAAERIKATTEANAAFISACAAARAEYEKEQEQARELDYKRRYAEDLKAVAAALDTLPKTAPEVYAQIIWSENGAIHQISTEENETAPRLTLAALDAIIKDVEINNSGAEMGYYKTKILIAYPGGSYTFRYDIESNPEHQERGIINHFENHLKWCQEMPEQYKKDVDFAALREFIEMCRAELGDTAPAANPAAVISGKLIKKLSNGGAAFKLYKSGSPVPGVFYAAANGAIKYRKTPADTAKTVNHTPGGKLATIARAMLSGLAFAICTTI